VYDADGQNKLRRGAEGSHRRVLGDFCGATALPQITSIASHLVFARFGPDRPIWDEHGSQLVWHKASVMVDVQSVEPLRKIVHELVFRYSATFIFVHQSQQPSDTRIGHRVSVFAESERRSGRNRDGKPRHDYRKELPSHARLLMKDDYFSCFTTPSSDDGPVVAYW
jgi:hypothetical protein